MFYLSMRLAKLWRAFFAQVRINLNRICSSDTFPLDTPSLSGITPAHLIASQRNLADCFWLDSATGGGDEWSYFGLEPLRKMRLSERKLVIHSNDNGRRIALLRQDKMAISDGPPFRGGWVGYIGYDAVPLAPFSSLNLNLFDTVLAYSHAQNRWWAAASLLHADSLRSRRQEAQRKVDRMLSQLDLNIAPVMQIKGLVPRTAYSNFTRAGYEQIVRRALEYIRAGDVYQINLAQRFTTAWEHSPLELYFRLREESPASYGAFISSGPGESHTALCSISPELFLRLRGREVLTRPIKGTSPLGAGRSLNDSPKERAELNMIVDLERNDLGRVCEYGSVRVQSAGEIEVLPTLLHRVAAVTGRLRRNCSAFSLLKAAFPGGSVTGAPKKRAMEIIAELEHSPRGPYCGAIGWIGLDGDMDMSIAIRTALYDGSRQLLHYHAGSGIVADSDPAREYDETLQKAAAFFRATSSSLEGAVRS